MAETKLSCFKDQKWSLHGMTALVTGGTRGIGFVHFYNVFYILILILFLLLLVEFFILFAIRYAVAEELAEFGASVHICARKQQDIDKCLEEWNRKGFSITGSSCDVLSRDQRENLMRDVASIFDGKLNILV